jgi:hypothetical protein
MSVFESVFDTIYGDSNFGTPALLTPSTDADELAITVIDETSGAVVTLGKLGIQSIKPAVSVRGSELTAAGLIPSDLSGGSVILRPNTPQETCWRIENYALKPSPAGELAGEVQIILIRAS